jgi:hypothetical protein
MSDNAYIVLVSIMLVFTGVLYGTKFLKAGNPLLGYEWYILAFSASNAALYFVNGHETHINIALFCDAFSRIVGIPVIGTLGIMQMTHDLSLSKAMKVGCFVLGAVVAAILRLSPSLNTLLPVGSAVIGLAFTWIMVHMIIRLFRIGNTFHGVLMTLTTVILFLVSMADGIFTVPNPHKIIFLDFWFFSNLVWALGFAEIYYAYRAIEASKQDGIIAR